MNKDDIRRIALESGVCDPALSTDDQLVTDYGDATESINKFAQMIEEIVLSTLRRLA